MEFVINESQLEQGSKPEEYLYLGEPFTGTAVETRGDGRIIWRCEFVNGMKNGLEREFNQSGLLIEEVTNRNNFPHGYWRVWHPSGVLKQEELLQYGVRLSGKYWSEEGVLVREFEIDADSFEYRLYEAYKAKWPSWQE